MSRFSTLDDQEEEKENAEKEEEKGSKVFSMVSYVLQKLRGAKLTDMELPGAFPQAIFCVY